MIFNIKCYVCFVMFAYQYQKKAIQSLALPFVRFMSQFLNNDINPVLP
jgi:hypothetical protein